MALKAALPSMASTKEMKFYSPDSVGSEDDPASDESFQLRLSDDEDCHNTDDGDNLLSKETEDEILNKFKFNDCKDKEEREKKKKQSFNDKDVKNVTNGGASKPVKENKNEETTKEESIDNKAENDTKSEKTTDESSKPLKETETEKKNEKEEETSKVDECSEKQKDSVKTVDAEEKANEIKEEKDKKSEEDEQKEIFKRQTNDTENLLDIFDVKPADENNLLQELKDPSSPSENSEKDENEEECEDMDNEKMEFDEKMDEETIGPEVDEAMDSIDIEENVLVQEDIPGDLKNIDKGSIEKVDTNNIFMERDKITESEEGTIKKEVTCDKNKSVSPSPLVPTNDDVTSSEKGTSLMTDASEKTSQKFKTIQQTDLSNETNEDSTKTKENESSSKSVKRSLPETTTDSEMEAATKRIKMLEKKDYYDKPKSTDTTTLKKDDKLTNNVETLNCLVEFMKSNVLTKLTRNNLEQLCLQKMCEAVMDKSEIGELRHQLKVQEQMIEHWRKEVTQLTKQARDLETVNTRLMSDFRARNERDKPIMPLKITRSVGLQVNPDNFILASRRKIVRNVPTTQNTATPSATATATSATKQTVVHTVAVTNGVVDSVTTQSNSAVTDIVTDSSVSTSASSFIDLTDEDDKKAAASTNNKRRSSATNNNNNNNSGTSSGSTSTVPVKSATTTLVPVTATSPNKSYRIVSPAVASGVTVSGATRLMYVVNSNPVQGIITTTTSSTTPKSSSLLKINTNGLVGQAASMRSSASVSRSQQSARPVQTVRPTTTPKSSSGKAPGARHPAPLPPTPVAQVSIASRKPVPPKPHLQIRKNGNAIVLSWKMPYNLTNFESIASYQLYAYQETSAAPSTDMWRKVGDIKALALPMACTLTQFADGNKYHFAVRAVDVLKRVGPFSEPGPILL